MSGGSWEYVSYKVEEVADRLVDTGVDESCSALRRALGEKLGLFARALHEIEWVDSFDTGPGNEEAAIRAALGEDADALALAVLVEDVKAVAERLEDVIGRVK